MVIRSAHHDFCTKMDPILKKNLSPIDAEFVIYIMYQDMEFGGARDGQDMRVKSLLRRYQNLQRDIGDKYLPTKEAIQKAAKIAGGSSDIMEVSIKKKLVFPLYVCAFISLVQDFNPEICRQVFGEYDRVVKSIKQPSLIDKLYNRDI